MNHASILNLLVNIIEISDYWVRLTILNVRCTLFYWKLYLNVKCKIFVRKILQWPNKSNMQNNVGLERSILLANLSQNFESLKRQFFEITTPFWLYRFSQTEEKNWIFFPVFTDLALGVLGQSLTLVATAPIIKIFQYFRIFWKYDTP